ncbi:MAG: ABC transporter permease [Anaerolineales bacterium]|nr:ABC transporter permease [Anaerolineales bacterium]
MKRARRGFLAGLALAASLVVIFLALPLLTILLGNSPESMALTLSDPEALRSLFLTFWAATLATGLAFLGGVPLAYLLARQRFRGKRLLEGLIDLPVVIPHTAAGIALLMVFGSRGVLGRWLAPLGVFFTDRLAGVVVAMLFVSLPYLVNLSREAFALIDPEMEAIALVEGASPWQAFLHVSFPLAWRGVAAGMLMMWARGISEFGAVVILAYHPKILPVLVYERFQGFGLSTAQPLAALLAAVVLILFGLLRWLISAGEQDGLA